MKTALIITAFALLILASWKPRKESVKIYQIEFKYSVGKLTKVDAG